jgi:hypothetical protein
MRSLSGGIRNDQLGNDLDAAAFTGYARVCVPVDIQSP